VLAARLALCSALTACAAAEEPGPRALYELERLSFVPPATCQLLTSDLSLGHAIVIDRYELTRADLRHYWPTRRVRAQEGVWSEGDFDIPEHADWPAFLDYREAEELAALRQMRLPTPLEWLHVAVGRRNFQTPWGGPGREFFANTQVVDQNGVDFSLHSPTAVGTYENGRSRPFGCYDMLGNAWEWVNGIVYGFEPWTRDPAEDYAYLDDDAGTASSVMGGAFDTPWRPTYEYDKKAERLLFHAWRLSKGTLAPSLGARMCADAGPYLWATAPRWGTGQGAEERVRAVGRRWAQDDDRAQAALKSLLADLRARPGAPAGLAWLEQGVLAGP
jgi:sulfatase-modifying factor enzyme 1